MRKQFFYLLILAVLPAFVLAAGGGMPAKTGGMSQAGSGGSAQGTTEAGVAAASSTSTATETDRVREPLDIDIHGYINSYDGVVLSSTGMYKLPTTENETYELLSSSVEANYGGVEVDGYYYGIEFSSVYSAYNTVFKYDASSWGNYISFTSKAGQSLCATDMTFDPATGNVYGCFLNDDGTGYVFGKFDVDTYTRTALFDLDDSYHGVAADADGTIYVIDGEGSLLIFDKQTGETTLIGSTGLNPHYVSSAAIDKSSGRMFFCYNPLGNEFGLYEIDKTTAEPTLLTPLFGSAQVTALEAGSNYGELSPAAATDVEATCEFATMTGSVTFTAPSTYYNGEAAEGEVTYSVISDDGVLLTGGTTSYGATVETAVTYIEEGEQTIKVMMSNSAGYGPKATTSVWAGGDTPNAPVATAVIGGDNYVDISWDAVTSSVNGLTISSDSVTYTVTRLPDSVVVAQSTAETSVVDSVAPYTYSTLYYSVVTEACGYVSEAYLTNNLIAYNEAPYTADFYNNYDLGITTVDSTWTIIDAQGSGKTWSNSGRYLSSTSSSGIIDAWAIFAIKLEGNSYYEIAFDLYNRYNCNSTASTNLYPLGFDLYYGNAATVNGMTNCLVESFRPTTSKLTTDFVVPLVTDESGIYYIGLHATSYGASSLNYFRVTCLTVSEGVDAALPVAVDNISIVPDADKEHKAQITCTAPEVNYAGDTLTSLTKIEVARGDTVVNTFESPSPGDTLTFTDYTPSAGMFTYTFTPYNEAGAGQTAVDSAFVGVYIPSAVPSFTALETSTDGEVTFTWTVPTTDANGEELDSVDVTYDIYDTSDGSVLVATGLTGTTYTYTTSATDEDTPRFMTWTIYSVTEGGTGEGTASSSISVGTPYSMPFRESFAGGEYETEMETEITSGTTSSAQFTLYTDQSAFSSVDGDNGLAGFYVKSGGVMAVSTGKIAVTGEAPVVSFWTYTNATSNKNTIYVFVRETGATDWTQIASYALTDYSKKVWVNFQTSLADYVGKSVQVRLRLGYTGTPNYNYIDYIYVGDTYDTNLAAHHVNLPSSIEFDEPFDVEAVIENSGAGTVYGYTVDLYRDNVKISSAECDSLEALSFATVTFTDSINVSYADDIEYYAVVSCDGDGNAADNTSDIATLTLELPDYPTVTTLEAEQTTDGVSLTWSAPDTSDFWYLPETTDSFESYDSWSTSAGDWLFVDVDSLGINYPSIQTIPGIDYLSTQSFFVFDATYGNFANYESYQAHSGDKYLMSIAPASGVCNDWLISPKLNGEAQTISFYLSMSQEDDGDGGTVYTDTYYVYYSTTGTDIDDFIQLSKKYLQVSTGSYWTTFESYSLPEGALYFAIRRATAKNEGFLFMVDDVTYTAADAAQTFYEIEGYNVWRDHEQMNSELVTSTSYIDTSYESGEAEYTVTVVYDCGESTISNVAVVNSSSNVKSDDNATTISSVQSSGDINISALNRRIVVTGAEGSHVDIYTAEGKSIYSRSGEEQNTVGVQPGVYIIHVGARTAKVVVK